MLLEGFRPFEKSSDFIVNRTRDLFRLVSCLNQLSYRVAPQILEQIKQRTAQARLLKASVRTLCTQDQPHISLPHSLRSLSLPAA
jgi:hypothetical protein